MNSSTTPPPPLPTPTPNTGILGEQLVAQWLQAQGWEILQQRWRCQWGEIDLIVQQIASNCQLAFVEVKTRSQGNWDADGLLAITPQKQAKIWQTAKLFLSAHPELVDLPCRFDVALVRCQRISPKLKQKEQQSDRSSASPKVVLGQPFFADGYQLILQDYIDSAFDCFEL